MSKGMFFRWLGAGTALAALCIAGCSGGGGGDDRGTSASVLFLNGSVDSAALDFLVDDQVEANDLPYLGTSQGFQDVDSGDSDIAAREEGAPIPDAAIVGSLGPTADYLALAIGRRSFEGENLKRLRILVIGVDRRAPDGIKARVLVVHGFLRASGFETPSIDFRSPGANPQFAENDIAYASPRVLLVDAGEQTFTAHRAGTDEVYAARTETLAAGKVYLALVTGVEGETGATAPQIHYVELPTESD